jgi:hypothetical protein
VLSYSRSEGGDGNKGDEEALPWRVQGEGGYGGAARGAGAGEAGGQAWHAPHNDCGLVAAGHRRASRRFDSAADCAQAASEAEVETLHAKIGQLAV